MRKALIALTLCLIGSNASAEIMQTFGCKLKEGKTIENLWTTLEVVRSEFGKLPITDKSFSLFVWLPMRGSTDLDYVLGQNNATLSDMAKSSADFIDAGLSATLGPRMAALGDCSTSSVSESKTFKPGKYSLKDDDRELDGVIETYACQFKPGKDLQDYDKAITYWNEQAKKLNSDVINNYEANRVTPIIGGSSRFDFGWSGVAPSLMAWAQGKEAYAASREGRAAQARLNSVGRCDSNLWAGYWVMAPST